MSIKESIFLSFLVFTSQPQSLLIFLRYWVLTPLQRGFFFFFNINILFFETEKPKLCLEKIMICERESKYWWGRSFLVKVWSLLIKDEEILTMLIPYLLQDQDHDKMLKGLSKTDRKHSFFKWCKGKTFFLKFQSSYVRILHLLYHLVQYFKSELKKLQLITLREVVT